jgi:hypothetical protein
MQELMHNVKHVPLVPTAHYSQWTLFHVQLVTIALPNQEAMRTFSIFRDVQKVLFQVRTLWRMSVSVENAPLATHANGSRLLALYHWQFQRPLSKWVSCLCHALQGITSQQLEVEIALCVPQVVLALTMALQRTNWDYSVPQGIIAQLVLDTQMSTHAPQEPIQIARL